MSIKSSIRSAQRAFTLIELMVVILILGILAALIVPKVINRASDAKYAACQSDESAIKSALDNFRIDCDRYPTTDEGLQALVSPPAGTESKWKGPYLPKGQVPVDPWGGTYTYTLQSADQYTIDSPETSEHHDVSDSN